MQLLEPTSHKFYLISFIKDIMRFREHLAAVVNTVALVHGRDIRSCMEGDCSSYPISRATELNTRQECDGYKTGSYIAEGDMYLKTFDTQTVTPTIGPFTRDIDYPITYDQSVSRLTSFDVALGDPFEIISLSVGVNFEDSETKNVTATTVVPAGQQGAVGFTPVYQCSTGTLENCQGVRTNLSESCRPLLSPSGFMQGDYRLIQF